MYFECKIMKPSNAQSLLELFGWMQDHEFIYDILVWIDELLFVAGVRKGNEIRSLTVFLSTTLEWINISYFDFSNLENEFCDQRALLEPNKRKIAWW